jgi:hypothetical protein
MTTTPFSPRIKPRQRLLFEEEPPAVPAAHLPMEVKRELLQALTQWMQLVIRGTRKEGSDE